MKRIYFILAGISLILFMSCARSEKGTKDTQTVKIDTAVSASSQTALQFPGKVKAAQDISLAFRVSGTIRKIYVEDGAPASPKLTPAAQGDNAAIYIIQVGTI